jgi:hypothetical protein
MVIPPSSTPPTKNKQRVILVILTALCAAVEIFRVFHLVLAWKYWLQWLPAGSIWLRLNTSFFLSLAGLWVFIVLLTRQPWSLLAARVFLLLAVIFETLQDILTTVGSFHSPSITVWILRGLAVLVLVVWIYVEQLKVNRT